ncbi:glycosyltransferase family 71 protein [Backusella circina FSU 941]|nr:glycosyltransferase family 71 protein [Backusella circina FSU 941]
MVQNICKEEAVLRNVDPNHTQAHIDFWRRLDSETIQAYQQKWKQFIAKAPAYPGFSKEKGIVLVAGNRDTFDRALTTCRFLRELYNSQIEIEIWHLADEHPSDKMKQTLALLNVETRDLSDPALPRPITTRSDAEKQFQIKAAAIINSAFSEVLYLDSDNVPTRDPSFLFDTEEYKQTGALFWPDFWKTHGENKIFDILDIACNNEWEQESGQMVIDKKRSWLPLQLAWYMQKNYEVYFQFLNGDKDTFKYAWQALDVPYHMTPTFLGMAGTIEYDRFCGHTMIQYYYNDNEQEDSILFVHANLMKISDKRHYLVDTNGTERPWQFTKRSTMSHQNTWIRPQFYISMKGQACMDFSQGAGEPESVIEGFDTLVPQFQENYFRLGGIGGETRA